MRFSIKTYAKILSLATAIPKTKIPQSSFSQSMSALLKLSESENRLLKKIAAATEIHHRYTVIPDFFESGVMSAALTTGGRNTIYKEEAPKLAEEACRKALLNWGRPKEEITHVISVSCTGMVAPGIEFLMIKRLGLSPNIERLGINFMGCFGAFKGLAIAKALAAENPQHRVLVVCIELCSLHFQADTAIDTFVANSLFADGAAATIVGTIPRDNEKPIFEIHHQASAALENTLDQMSWEAGDFGYQMRLSAAVSSHLENHILAFSKRLIGSHQVQDIIWALHPGGKSILESITKACNLNKKQLAASWKVLSQYGNMSSPTFLFVLEEISKTTCSHDWTLGLGFGPGLSMEGVFLKNVGLDVAR